MLKSAFRKFVDEATPHLSSLQRERLARGLYKMTLGWAAQPAEKRPDFLKLCQHVVAQQVGSRPTSFRVELRCAERGRSVSQITDAAKGYLTGVIGNVTIVERLLPSPNLAFDIDSVDRIEENLIVIRSRISGKGLSEKDLRRAISTSRSSSKRRLGLSATNYSQMSLFAK